MEEEEAAQIKDKREQGRKYGRNVDTKVIKEWKKIQFFPVFFVG
jgi:hypothetical protein